MAEAPSLHVLIAYDGSSNAGDAVRAAAQLFPGARASVLFADDATPVGELAAAGPDEALLAAAHAYERAALADARERASHGRQLAESAGLRATEEVGSGQSAWRSIVRAAQDLDVDAIICGSRGHGAFSRTLLGSVSASLLHHADRPVLVVPAASADASGPALLAYDGSEGSRHAVAAAVRLLPDRQAVVACAWTSPLRRSFAGAAAAALPLPSEGDELIGTFEELLAADAEERAAEGAELARAAGSAARPLTVEAVEGTWRALAGAARKEGAAILVAGSRGRGALTSTVLGSVSAGLAHNAELPVLVVREASA